MTFEKMLPTRFTNAESDLAHEEWKFNCGPGALCGLLRLTPTEIRPRLYDFENKGYTNPTLMRQVVESLGLSVQQVYRQDREVSNAMAVPWPKFGLVRIQFTGKWTKPGVPMRVRYWYTHWMAVRCPVLHPAKTDTQVAIFDVNTMGRQAANKLEGWCSLKDWMALIEPQLRPDDGDGWFPTHLWEVSGDWAIVNAMRNCAKCAGPLEDGGPLLCQPCANPA